MGGKKTKQRIKKTLRSFRAVKGWQLFLILIPLCFVAATLLRFDHIRMVELRKAVLEADKTLGVAVAREQGSDTINEIENILNTEENAGDATENTPLGTGEGIEGASGNGEASDGGMTVEEAETRLQAALEQLREFTFSHIVVNVIEKNGQQQVIFGTGPFYLEQAYLRAANRAIAAVEDSVASDANPNGNIYEAVRQICQPMAIQYGWAWTSAGYIECWTSELAKYPTTDGLDPNVITAAVPSTELYRRNYASPLWAPTAAGWVLLACVILAVVVAVRFVVWVVLRTALLFIDR